MVRISEVALLTGASSVAAAFQIPGLDQLPLGPLKPSAGGFQCDLPPAIDPSGDGLPSAEDLFSSNEALKKQVERHAAIVRVPSVSYDDNGEPKEDPRWAPFWDLHETLASLYPLLHEKAKLDKVNTLGLVYTLQGSDPDLKPTLLAAHQDVVPVADESTWKHPPFAAVYDGEYLWGRGSSDDKNSLTALLSATETLLAQGWVPERTLVLAFGFDEECSGHRGAATIADYLLDEYGPDGVAVILDEGGMGLARFGDVLYALPAVTEKGYVEIWLELSVVGGHSSIPFPHTSIGIVSEMVTALEAHPAAPSLLRDGPVHRHLQCQTRYSPGAMPRVDELLGRDDLEALSDWLADEDRLFQYMIQTSQSVDMISGGQKINAMPEHVLLGVNYRVAPQDSIPLVQHNVVRYVNDTVNKYGLRLRAYEGDSDYEDFLAGDDSLVGGSGGAVAPSWEVDYNGTLTLDARAKTKVAPVTPTEGDVWNVFSGVVQHTFRAAADVVVPVGEIMTGNTDTRHYQQLSPHIFRFTPHTINGSINIHTIDERIHMGEHMDVVKFYYNFIRSFDQAEL